MFASATLRIISRWSVLVTAFGECKIPAQTGHAAFASVLPRKAGYQRREGSSEHPIGELRQAIDLDKDIRLVALDDEDFYVLDWIGDE